MTTAFPLAWPDGWPRTPRNGRKASQFKTGYLAAYDNLMHELRLLGATNVTVSSHAPLRRDGKPYSEAMNDELEDPGVAVYFRMPEGARVMARDGHPTPAENLHAIGHVIGHLRGLTRHGGAGMMARAFAGFTALPAPKSPWEVLGLKPGSPKETIEAAYRAKAKTAHSDVGGTDAAMSALNVARDSALKEIGAT